MIVPTLLPFVPVASFVGTVAGCVFHQEVVKKQIEKNRTKRLLRPPAGPKPTKTFDARDNSVAGRPAVKVKFYERVLRIDEVSDALISSQRVISYGDIVETQITRYIAPIDFGETCGYLLRISWGDHDFGTVREHRRKKVHGSVILFAERRSKLARIESYLRLTLQTQSHNSY